MRATLGTSSGRLRFAFWLGVALLGQVATLLLLDAGPVVRFHHYLLPWQLQRELQWFAVAVLAAQFTLLLLAGRHVCRAAAKWLLARFRWWQVALIVVLFILVSAVPSRSPVPYAFELLWAALLQGLQLVTVLLAIAALPSGLSRLAHAANRRFGSSALIPGIADRFSVTLAGGALLVTALLAWLVYQTHPHVPDEVVYLYHARYFASGMMTMPAPPVPAAFDLDLMQYEPTRWYSPVPPGWPGLLAVGVWLGLPWLVTPLLSAACVLFGYGLLRELYSVRTARLGAVLLAASPWLLFLGMSFMTHTAALAFALIASYAVARLRRTGHLVWAALGGAGIGVVALIRPLEGVMLAALLGIWTLGTRGRRFRLAPSLALTIATALAVLPVLPYNRELTGNPLRFAINAYTDQHYGAGSNALGFGSNRGLGWSGLDPFPGHGPRDVVVNTALNASMLNLELFGWGSGSLLLLWLFLIAGRWSKSDRWMLAALITVPAVHGLYWFSGGPDFGPRYWYLMIFPAVALSARGFEWLTAGAMPMHGATNLSPDRALSALAVFISLSLLLFVPWRSLDKYHGYRGMQADVRRMSQQPALRNALVLVRGRRHPDYASAAIYNPIDLLGSDAPIFAWDRDRAVRAELRRVYPLRRVWLLEGPTVTGDSYRLTGPLSWSEADR